MKKKGDLRRYTPNKKDRDKAWIMAAAGMRREDIAAVLQISRKTLYTHYKKELETASTDANGQVAQSLFQMTKKNPGSAMFWMKCRAHWRETDHADEKPAVSIQFVGGEIPARIKAQRGMQKEETEKAA